MRMHAQKMVNKLTLLDWQCRLLLLIWLPNMPKLLIITASVCFARHTLRRDSPKAGIVLHVDTMHQAHK